MGEGGVVVKFECNGVVDDLRKGEIAGCRGEGDFKNNRSSFQTG